MTYSIDKVTTWEAFAVAHLLQSQLGSEREIGICGAGVEDEETNGILRASGLTCLVPRDKPALFHPIQIDAAFRRIDQSSKESYPEVLMVTSNLPPMTPFPSLSYMRHPVVASEGGIVVCPFGIRREMDLPSSVWRTVVRHLRTYDRRVFMMGDRGARQDECQYTESEILSDAPVAEKYGALHAADLIVGSPNAWTWAGSAWRKKMVVFYPDNLPPKRWLPYVYDEMGVVQFGAYQLQIPIVLAGLRKMIGQL